MLPVIFVGLSALAQQPFLSRQQWEVLRDESNGAVPFENLRYLTTLHRVPATSDFDEAAQFILQRARQYGLAEPHSEQFSIDGNRTYGLMRSYFAWSVEEGSLWEVRPQHLLLADWKTDPIRLADYSRTADVEAELIDVGSGTDEADYKGKDVRGKIVLAAGGLSLVQEIAVTGHGAAGIVSDMPNQSSAWSGLDPTLVRWGHLDARQPSGFAFMISREAATSLRIRLSAREQIILKASVKAEVGPGHWTVISGTIPGTDPSAGEIVYSCHLDHQRPGANDNGSGCVTILESARILARLIETGQLTRPMRTLRFVWGPEIEGTMAFLASHPEIRRRLRANVHMDMVGGDPFKNKAVLHVTGTPWSLPSFVTDVGATFLDVIRESAASYAAGEGAAREGIVETRAGQVGTRNELFADVTPYMAGSDHEEYDSSTIAVPSLYLCDWPDIYIHTDHDSLLQIDATKLRRVALLGAAAGYVYASLDAQQTPRILPFLAARSQARLAQASIAAQQMVSDSSLDPNVAWYEARNLLAQSLTRETAALRSFVIFTGAAMDLDRTASKALGDQVAVFQVWIDSAARQRGVKGLAPRAPWSGDAVAARVPARVGEFGPLTYQNDNVLLNRLGKDRYSKVKLIHADANRLLNLPDRSEQYEYEIVNLVDGKRTIGEIRDVVAAEYGPISLSLVADYLNACVEAGIMQMK